MCWKMVPAEAKLDSLGEIVSAGQLPVEPPKIRKSILLEQI
jgi:hypothetical protein